MEFPNAPSLWIRKVCLAVILNDSIAAKLLDVLIFACLKLPLATTLKVCLDVPKLLLGAYLCVVTSLFIRPHPSLTGPTIYLSLSELASAFGFVYGRRIRRVAQIPRHAIGTMQRDAIGLVRLSLHASLPSPWRRGMLVSDNYNLPACFLGQGLHRT